MASLISLYRHMVRAEKFWVPERSPGVYSTNIQSVYIRGWQEASNTAMALDLTSGSITGWQMYQIAKEN